MDAFSTGFIAGLILFGLFLYLLPTLTAVRRCHPRWQAIAVVNILLGWTIVGWIVAAIWACLTPESRRAFKDA